MQESSMSLGVALFCNVINIKMQTSEHECHYNSVRSLQGYLTPHGKNIFFTFDRTKI